MWQSTCPDDEGGEKTPPQIILFWSIFEINPE
jgi:hypothetical protein